MKISVKSAPPEAIVSASMDYEEWFVISDGSPVSDFQYMQFIMTKAIPLFARSLTTVDINGCPESSSTALFKLMEKLNDITDVETPRDFHVAVYFAGHLISAINATGSFQETIVDACKDTIVPFPTPKRF